MADNFTDIQAIVSVEPCQPSISSLRNYESVMSIHRILFVVTSCIVFYSVFLSNCIQQANMVDNNNIQYSEVKIRPINTNTDIAVRNRNYHTATGNHMSYGITQCYLPPSRGDFPAFTRAEAGTRFSNPGGMQG